MALTADQLQANRDALLSALKNNYRRVRFSDGREAEFNSPKEVRDALSIIDSAIAAASGTASSKRKRIVVGSDASY